MNICLQTNSLANRPRHTRGLDTHPTNLQHALDAQALAFFETSDVDPVDVRQFAHH